MLFVIFVVLLTTSVFSSAVQSEVELSLYEQVNNLPEDFQDHFFGSPVSARVVLDQKTLGDAMVILSSDNTVQILNFIDSYDSEYSDFERDKWKQAFFEPISLGKCDQSCPPNLLAVSYNLETAQLVLVSNNDNGNDDRWLELPESGSYGMMITNHFSLSAQGDRDPSMGWRFNMESSIGQWTVLGQGMVDRSHDSELNYAMNSLYVKKQRQGQYVRAGFFTPDSLGVLRQPTTNGGRLQTMFGVMMGSSDALYISENNPSLYPIYISANRDSVAEIYRNGVLINSQSVLPGLQVLDTTSLPQGVYEIDVVILEDGKEISRSSEMVHKPLGWNNTAQRMKYNIFSGKSTNLLNNSAENHSDMMLGGSVNYLLDSNLIGSLAIHNIGSELQKGIAVDWKTNDEFNFFGNVYHSNQSSYGYNTQAVWRYTTGSLIANHSQRWDTYGDDTVTSRNTNTSLSLNQRLDTYSSVNARISRNSRGEYGYDLGYGTKQTLLGTDVSWRLSVFDRPYSQSSSDRNWGADLSISFSLGNQNDRASVAIGSRNDAKGSRDAYMSATIDKRWRDGPFTSGSATVSADRYGAGVSATGRYDSQYANGSLWGQYTTQNTLAAGMNLDSSVVLGKGEVAVSKEYLRNGGGIIIDVDSDDPNVELVAYQNRSTMILRHGRNVIPVNAWEKGQIELNVLDTNGPALQVWPNQIQYQINRGGVEYQKVRVMKTLTVMGRIIDAKGTPQGGVRVVNHAGRAVTHQDGFFTLEMHAHNPVVSIKHPDGQECEIYLDPSQDSEHDMLFAGDLRCEQQLALNNLK